MKLKLAFLATVFAVAISSFIMPGASSAAVPDGYESKGNVTLYGEVGKTDSDGYHYIPLAKLNYTTVNIAKKNNVAATSVVAYDHKGNLVKALSKVDDTTWQLGQIEGTKVELTGKDTSPYQGYFAWFRGPSGNMWMYDYNGQRFYLKANGENDPPSSGQCAFGSAGTVPSNGSFTSCSNANRAWSARTIDVGGTLSEKLHNDSIPGDLKFELDQVAKVIVEPTGLKYFQCRPLCMSESKVHGTRNINVDDSNKNNITIDFEFEATYDGTSPGGEVMSDTPTGGLVKAWYNGWNVDFKAETYKYGDITIYAKYEGTPDPCATNPSAPGCNNTGDPTGGGRVIFTPNDTTAKDGSIVRGWARYNFTVTASVVDYVKAEKTTNVPWRKPQPCIPWSSPTGGGCTPQPDLTGTAVYYCWRDKEDNITITGSYSGTNSVQITNEGYQQKLSGQVNWKPYQWR